MRNLPWALLWIITLFVIALFLWPFICMPFIRMFMPVWGYFIARRKRRLLWKLAIAQASVANVSAAAAGASTSAGNTSASAIPAKFTGTPPVDRREFELLQDLVNNWREDEWKYFDEIRKEQIDLLADKLKDIKEKSANVDVKYIETKKTSEQSIIVKSVSKVAETIDKEMGRNVLLLVGMCVILAVDVLIARQIFRSLGIGTDETSITLWKKKLPVDYPLIYGIFMTIIAAFALHWLWRPKGRMESFLKNSKWSIVMGILVLVFFFIVRLSTVFVPDSASRIMEVLTLACWMIGVVAVYWLSGEIVGEQDDWFKMLIAIAAPIVIVLCLLFGSLSIFKQIAEWGSKSALKSWFELRRARAEQQGRNAEEKHQGAKKGFYRGLTL
jgi:hypothetical protein